MSFLGAVIASAADIEASRPDITDAERAHLGSRVAKLARWVMTTGHADSRRPSAALAILANALNESRIVIDEYTAAGGNVADLEPALSRLEEPLRRLVSEH